MKKLLLGSALLALVPYLGAEDFRPEPIQVTAQTHPNDFQRLLEQMKRYGRVQGHPDDPMFGIALPGQPEHGEHVSDYLVFGEGMNTNVMDIIHEVWEKQVDPAFARRLTLEHPYVFWRIFGAWPAEGAAPADEARAIEEFVRRHPEVRATLAARDSSIEPAQAKVLLNFLDAHPALREKYSHWEYYVDQWLLHLDGPALGSCDHNLIIQNRGTYEHDPLASGNCGPEAVAQYRKLLKFWLAYKPAPGEPAPQPHEEAAPHVAPPQSRSPFYHNLPEMKSPTDNPLFQKIQFGGHTSCAQICRDWSCDKCRSASCYAIMANCGCGC